MAALSSSSTVQRNHHVAEAFSVSSMASSPRKRSGVERPIGAAVVVTPEKKLARNLSLSQPEDNNEAPLAASQSTADKTKKKKASVPKKATKSFGAVTAATWPHLTGEDKTKTPLHTIILGTHPSIASLEKSQYYGHPQKYACRRYFCHDYIPLDSSLYCLTTARFGGSWVTV